MARSVAGVAGAGVAAADLGEIVVALAHGLAGVVATKQLAVLAAILLGAASEGAGAVGAACDLGAFAAAGLTEAAAGHLA